MERYCSTGQSPQRAVAPTEEEEVIGNNILFLILNFRRVLNVVCCLLGNSLASEFYMPTFRNTTHPSYLSAYEDGRDRVFQNVGI